MRIEDWPMNRIMQLPDWCFGRRWPMSLSGQAPSTVGVYDITEAGLPEMCVLWEVNFTTRIISDPANTVGFHCIIRMGHRIVTNLPDLYVLNELIPGYGYFIAGHRSWSGDVNLRNLKIPIHSMGRRLVGYLVNDGAAGQVMQLTFVFSGVPKEVPDWLVSDKVSVP